MATQIQLRSDLGANWTSVNPILLGGEMGFDSTMKNIKIGDGVTAWNSLSYLIPTVPPPKNVSVITTVGNITVSAATLLAGYLCDNGVQTANFTFTTDTAVNIASAFPQAVVGTSFVFRFMNNSSANFTAVLAAGTGITIAASPFNTTIPQYNFVDYLFVFTAVGSAPALTVSAIGGGGNL